MSFKIVNILRNHQYLLNTKYFVTSKRNLLTAAYQCNEEWNKRLNEPMIRDIELDSFFYQLNEKLSKKTSVRPTDIDLYLNKSTVKNLDEILNVVQRFRKNWRSHGILESSHHAFMRIMIENNDMDQLVDILSKRIEYGIFPDKFCYNILLDKLIESKQFENATKVAVLRMLQEDLDSTIGNYFSLKAIHTYLSKAESIQPELFKKPDDQTAEQESTAADGDEDEVEYIRVPYIRNPFFDDHFDLKETYALIGKTFYLVGNAIKNQNETLSDNCILYGLVLYKKWNKISQFLEQKQNQIKLSTDLIDLVEKYVSSFEEPIEDANKIMDQLKEIKTKSTSTLEQLIDEAVATIGKLEANEIEELKKMFQEFTKKRNHKLKADLDYLLRMEVIEQIKEKKKEFRDRELKLYFFENYEKFMVLEKDAKEKIKASEESMNIEEEYIPPRVDDRSRV